MGEGVSSWDRQVPGRCQPRTGLGLRSPGSILSPCDLGQSSNTLKERVNSGFVGKRDTRGFTHLFSNAFNRACTYFKSPLRFQNCEERCAGDGLERNGRERARSPAEGDEGHASCPAGSRVAGVREHPQPVLRPW